MDASGAVAFWSYAHQDNERDGEGIVRLAAHIQDEFALATGESLNLFLDRNDIMWGQEWRRRIDSALVETTFFIPVITPLYFKRPECRRELLSFMGQAQSLGAIELLMPILYVDVPGLAAGNADEAQALVARMHYSDWREIRLRGENSIEYRREVHSLAMRLVEIFTRHEQIANQFAEDVSESEVVEEGEEEEQEGTLDLMALVEEKIYDWQEKVDDSTTIAKQADAIVKSYGERLRKIPGSAQRMSGAQLSILRKAAGELEPLMRRDLELTKSYSAASIELDPIILTLLRDLENYPELIPAVLAILSPIEKAYSNVEENEQDDRQYAGVSGLAEKYKGMSKDMLRISRLWDILSRNIDDSNLVLKNWHREIQKYKSKE